MLQSKIKQFYYPRSQDLICNQRIGVLKIHSKSLAYITGKLTDAWRTPISYESSVVAETDSDDFFLLLLVLHLLQENIFCSTSRWLLLKRKNDIFNNYNKMKMRDVFAVAKICNRIGLKRYLMNRSSRFLLNFLFRFAKGYLIKKAIQWNFPIADIPNSGHAMNSGQNL